MSGESNNSEMRAIRTRLDFSKIPTSIQIPNLIEVQRRSYERFLQMDKLPQEREDNGLQSVFTSVFPITDFRNVSELEFVDYSIGNWECKCGYLKGLNHLRTACTHCGHMVITDPFHPGDVLCNFCGTYNKNTPDFCTKCGDPVGLQLKYDQAECEERGMTYSAPLKVTIRLKIYDKDPETGVKSLRDMKEQEVFFGDIPLMSANGTFIVNGTERVIVSQLHRSPGVFFETANNRTYFLGKIIPYRGSWVEFEYDQKNTLYVRIDRKRKFLGTIFLRALGLRTDEEILKTFYTVDTINVKDGKLSWKVVPEGTLTNLQGTRPAHAIMAKGEELAPATRKISAHSLKGLRSHKIEAVEVETSEFDGAMTAADVVDLTTGELLYEANQELTADKLHKIIQSGVTSFEVFFPERDDVGNIITNTLRRDSVRKPEEALIEIYRKLRPGDPPTLDTATALFEGMFFDARKYDFSRVGRLKFNIKLYENQDPSGLDKRTLTPEDFYGTIRYLLKLRKNIGTVDDIDHLGNRRVRAVGELMENQFRIGLVRMERAIKEKMSVYQEMSTAMPHDLINAKPVMAAIREFFGSSQLSQFMDQTNPLSEITHKRRLSALGPGGLSRERAGFEVRDVHPTHYGRICPIETPEGPNIGLISSLSCFARINEYGFIESPYRRVKDGRALDYVSVTNAGESGLRQGDYLEISEARKLNEQLKKDKKRAMDLAPFSFYLSAWEEDRHTIAQANIELDAKLNIVQDVVDARRQGNFVLVNKSEVDYVDVSPKQLVSVAASLVPFLEHDDANRALMGANMQRQSVPLLVSEAPFVGTGMEGVTARDSGAVILAKRNGIVDSVDSERIIVRVEGEHHPTQLSREVGSDIYQLTKFKRSNQNTCINQKPIVRKGDRVIKGQVIADGPCTEQGELGLGRNVLVAFMPWRGYNFEDAILISEKLVREDYYTSIHIEEFEIEARDTKLGPEEITRDIPNVSEHALRDLDESGIIRIGAKIGQSSRHQNIALRPARQQIPGHLRPSRPGRHHILRRGRLVIHILRIDLRAAFQQVLRNRNVCGKVQRPLTIPSLRMHQRRVRRHKLPHPLRHTQTSSRMNIHSCPALDKVRRKLRTAVIQHAKAARPPLRSRVDIRTRLQQRLDHRAIALIHRANQSRSVKIKVWQRFIDLRLQNRMPRNHLAHQRSVIRPDRRLQSLRRILRKRFDASLQLRPAIEAILPRNHTQRIGKFRRRSRRQRSRRLPKATHSRRIILEKFSEQLPCLFFEMFEVRARR